MNIWLHEVDELLQCVADTMVVRWINLIQIRLNYTTQEGHIGSCSTDLIQHTYLKLFSLKNTVCSKGKTNILNCSIDLNGYSVCQVVTHFNRLNFEIQLNLFFKRQKTRFTRMRF